MILLPGRSIHPHGSDRYRYHLNGPVHMMTARKRVGPLPTHRLAVRHSVDYSSSDHFSLDDSSRDSSSSSSSKTSSDSSVDALSDSASSRSSSDHSLPTPSSGYEDLVIFMLLGEAGLGVDFEDESSEPARSRGANLEMDVNVVRSDGIDIDPEIQADIDECIAYADALRDRGIDVRVVVEAVDRREGAIEVTYKTLGDLVNRFHDHTKEIPVHRVKLCAGSQRRVVGVTGMELRQIWRFRFNDRIRISRLEDCARRSMPQHPVLEHQGTREGMTKLIDSHLGGALGVLHCQETFDAL
ncbi:hypothetical protein Tco_0900274 [Tanacetum coccineum]